METERKFLVVADQAPPLRNGALIEQGYLVFQNPPEVSVELRLRRVDEADCFLTIKSGNAPTRVEVELAVAPDQFLELWPLTEGRRVFKRRHRIPVASGLTAELDVYEGARAGLQVVEVEFHPKLKPGILRRLLGLGEKLPGTSVTPMPNWPVEPVKG